MKRKIFSVLFALVLVLSFSLIMAVPTSANTDRLVPDPYGTIQAAINAAEAGDTIIVSDGEYPGDLIVAKANLTLKSVNGRDVTTIQGAGAAGVISVNAAHFTLGGEDGHGFTVIGATSNRLLQCETSVTPYLTVSYNAFDTTGTPSQGVSLGTGGNNITISHNMFAVGGDSAIYVGASTADVDDLVVDSNVFNGSRGAWVNWVGPGGTNGAMISNNIVTSCHSAIRMDIRTGALNNVTYTGNTIVNGDISIGPNGSGSTSEITNLAITENSFTGPAWHDVFFEVIGSVPAVLIDYDTLTVARNNFVGAAPGDYAVINGVDGTILNAEWNWWGDASGPTHSGNPDGTGGAIREGETYGGAFHPDGDVDYAPWSVTENYAIQLDSDYYEVGQAVNVMVGDLDANLDPVEYDEITVKAISENDPTGEDVTLTETGVNTGGFSGSFNLVGTTPPGTGNVYVVPVDTITVSYAEFEAATATVLDSYSPSIAAELPDLVRGDPDVKGATITVTNPEGGVAYSDLVVEMTLDADEDFETTDIDISEVAGASGPTKAVEAGDLVVTFTGFAIAPNAEEDITFKLQGGTGAPLGSYDVTVGLLDGQYLLADTSTTMTVSEAADLMVEVPEKVNIVDEVYDPVNGPPPIFDEDVHKMELEVTILGKDFEGPDGLLNSHFLNTVDITVTGPNVDYEVTGAYSTGSIWESDADGLPDGVSEVDATTLSFEVSPNEAGTITVTVDGLDDDGNVVSTDPVLVEVEGYKELTVTPAGVAVNSSSDIAATLKMADGSWASKATLMIWAVDSAGEPLPAFEKTIDGTTYTGELIVVVGPLDIIKYIHDGGEVATEPYTVTEGKYEVTDIKFVELGDVHVYAWGSQGGVNLAAFLTEPAFSIIPPSVYDVSLVPNTITAGIESEVLVTVTETVETDEEPVTEIDSIEVNGTDVTPGTTTSETGEYTITVAPIPEGTYTVTVTGDIGTKLGTAELHVGLPVVVDYTIYDSEEVPRDVMLKGVNYTLDVSVNDALGAALASGNLWIGTYDEVAEEFTQIGSPATITEGVVEGFGVTAPDPVDDLVWVVGSSASLAEGALVLTPWISVEELTLSLDYAAPVIVNEPLEVTVINNYDEPQTYRNMFVVDPYGEFSEYNTSSNGKFAFTPAFTGVYEVYESEVLEANLIDIITVVAKVLESISAEPSPVPLLVDETQPLTVTALYSDTTTDDVTDEASYESSDPLVATVSEAGIITAVAEGSATITVSYTEGGITKTAEVLVTVSEAAVTKGDFDGDGDIDLADFVAFVAAYGSITDDANYNVAGDFDDDGDIDLADFVEFVAVYGT